jgi:hypothetical protein
MILLVSESKTKLKGTWAGKYIEWGEKKGWHKSATCDGRASESHNWYDLTGHKRGVLFWPKSQQYKHSAPRNRFNLQANCNLYDLHLEPHIDADVLAGVLNSSWAVLAKFQFGRPVGNEGNLKTEVVDVKMMPVPDPRQGVQQARRVAAAFLKLAERPAMQFLSERRMRSMAWHKGGREADLASLTDVGELDMADRRELDDAVLEMLGVRSAAERTEWLRRLYEYLHGHFELVRQKEEKAIVNKNTSARRSAKTAVEVAAEIIAELREKHDRLLLPFDDFVDNYGHYDTYEVPANGIAERHQDMFSSVGAVRFMKGKRQHGLVQVRHAAQAELLVIAANHGVRGLVRLPLESSDNERLLSNYVQHLRNRQQRIAALAAERTSDADFQNEIVTAAEEIAQRSHEAG